MSDLKTVGPDEMVCSSCGAVIKKAALQCPKCGVATMSWDAVKHGYSKVLGVQNGIGKKWLTTLLLAVFLGWLGIHRFYVGKIGTGILWFLTLGISGIGWIIDIIFILTGQFKDKKGNYIKRQPQSANDKV